MIPRSTISDDARKIIQEQIKEFATEHNIRILLAIESGSRAWGFPSQDSDYDVRFIYAQTMDDYLSIKPERDVIEPKITHNALLGVPFDLSGWDIRKALRLALKSNPVLFEWLQSPICYAINQEVTQKIMHFAASVVDLKRVHYHYYQLAVSAWLQIEEDPQQVVLKRYFYALRPALAVQWVTTKSQIPPMDLSSLVRDTVKDKALENAILELVTLKSTAQEKAKIPHDSLIDSFIKHVLSEHRIEQRPPVATSEYHDADLLFRRIIQR